MHASLHPVPLTYLTRILMIVFCVGWTTIGTVAADADALDAGDDIALDAEVIDNPDDATAEPDTDAVIAERKARPMPTAFPDVSTVADAVPRFAAVRLDPWAKNILYVMFDGNAEVGYNRMYAWVPEGQRYTQPTPFQIGGDNRFPAVTWTDTEGDEAVDVAYIFGSVRTTGVHGGGGGGGGTRVNYLTGEVTVTPPRSPGPPRPYTNISFSYSVDYKRDKSPRGGANLLQLRIPANLNPPTNFVGLRPSALWNSVSFHWNIDRQTVTDIDHAQLKFGGSVRVGNRDVLVASMPTGFFDVEIRVSPYMKDPFVRETVPVQELARDGLFVSVPFGWYRASWSTTTHPWIGGRDLSGQTSGLMALSRSRPAVPGSTGGGGGGGATSALRGPPPSQLRGPGR